MSAQSPFTNLAALIPKKYLALGLETIRMMERGKGFLRHFHKGGTPQNNAPTVPEPPAQEYYSGPNQTGQTFLGVSSYEPPRINQYVFQGSPAPAILPPFELQPMPFMKENAGSETSHIISPSNGQSRICVNSLAHVCWKCSKIRLALTCTT